MKKLYLSLLFLMSYLSALELAVVADKNFPDENLTKEEIKEFFLSKRNFIEEKRILVMNFEANSPLRICFEKNILEKSRVSLERYWRKAYYQGKRPPKVIKSKEMLSSYVEEVSPSLGYSEFNTTLNQEFKVLLTVECDQ